jgi:hypothetical protein
MFNHLLLGRVTGKWFNKVVYVNRSVPWGLKKKFAGVFSKNSFGGETSLSGRGSDLDQTKRIQEELPKLLIRYGVKSIIDLPCGDQNWISKVPLGNVTYVGADIVPELVLENTNFYGSSNRTFIELDITKEIPPRAELILCRDLLVHLNTKQIYLALRNIKRSGATYILTTSFTDNRPYKNLPIFTRSVGWRAINLQSEPFNFPEPLEIVNEECTEGAGEFSDKSLALWKVADLPL